MRFKWERELHGDLSFWMILPAECVVKECYFFVLHFV